MPEDESPYRTGKLSHINGYAGVGDIWKDVTQLEWRDKRNPPAWFQAELFGLGGQTSPTAKLTDMFDIIMVIDHREKKAMEEIVNNAKNATVAELASNGICMRVEFRPLTIGDAMWIARHKKRPEVELVLDMIAERKSCADLFSSIVGKQGSTVRYHEQKRRIMTSGISNRLYVVEGHDYDIDTIQSNIPIDKRHKIFHTSLAETGLSGFQIVHTDDRRETVKRLLAFTRRLCLSPKVGGCNLTEYMQDKDIKKVEFNVFNDRMSLREDGDQTVGRVTESMLLQIPGMGKDAVETYLRGFPTLQSFVTAFVGVYTLDGAAQVLRQKTRMTRSGPVTKMEEQIFRLFGRCF